MLVGCWSEPGGCCVSLLIDGLLFRFGVLWVGCLRVCHIGGFGCVAVWWLLGLWVDVWWNTSGCCVVWMGHGGTGETLCFGLGGVWFVLGVLWVGVRGCGPDRLGQLLHVNSVVSIFLFFTYWGVLGFGGCWLLIWCGMVLLFSVGFFVWVFCLLCCGVFCLCGVLCRIWFVVWVVWLLTGLLDFGLGYKLVC